MPVMPVPDTDARTR